MFDLGVWEFGQEAEMKCRVLSFPVKHIWQNKADQGLIVRSSIELMELIRENLWRQELLPAQLFSAAGLSSPEGSGGESAQLLWD